MQNLNDLIHHTLSLESAAISEVRDNMDYESITKAAGMILGCKGKVLTSGCGTSGAAGRKIAHTLNCVECPAMFMEPSDAVHGGMGAVCNGDIAVLLSRGGVTGEILGMVAPLKKKGARIIGVTEDPDSPLAQASDLVLKIKISREADKFNMLATSTILATLAVFDAIAVCIVEQNGFSEERFSVIHPGGRTGQRLQGKG